MDADQIRKVIQLHFEQFNSRDLDWSVAQAADEVVWRDVPSGRAFRRPAGFEIWMSEWLSAFPDAWVRLNRVDVSAPGLAVAEFTAGGTHQGMLRVRGGRILPTGKKIRVPFCEIFRFEDGKIVEARLYYDQAGVIRQLGVMSLLEAA